MTNKQDIQISDIGGSHDVMIEIKEYYKKLDGVVYKFYKIGNEDWKYTKTPFAEVPYNILSSS